MFAAGLWPGGSSGIKWVKMGFGVWGRRQDGQGFDCVQATWNNIRPLYLLDHTMLNVSEGLSCTLLHSSWSTQSLSITPST
jgi:hypothetical protein